MIRRLLGDVPAWAQANSPVLRYEMQKQQTSNTFSIRLASAAGQVLFVILFLSLSVLMATRLFTQPAGVNRTQALWHILYLPTIGVQVLLSAILLLIGGSTVSAERRRQTWDHLRVTTTGAELLLHVRLLAVFYRVRLLFALAFAARFAIVATILIEISSHHGDYLTMLVGQASSSVSPIVGILLMAAAITAAFMMPFTQAALDVALSLLLTTAIPHYPWSVMSQMALVMARVLSTISLSLLGLTLLGGAALPAPLAWVGLVGAIIGGDQGLLIMQITQASAVWRVLPYGVFIGGVALILTLIQAGFAAFVLRLAVRRAEHTEG